MSIPPRESRAFTLVELLVVIAIIGILIALLLPAVQAAREAARRVHCSNNAKQLALAMHNYHEKYVVLPACYRGTVPGWTGADMNGHSWLQAILPYIEQEPLYQQIEFGLPVGGGNPGDASYSANTEVSRTVVPGFLCPSDSNQQGLMASRANVGDTRAVTNYKGCAGSNWGWGDPACRHTFPSGGHWPNSAHGLDEGNGVIFRNYNNYRQAWIRFAEITDGTSNTFALGEAVPRWCNHTWWWWFNGSTATCGVPLNYVSIAIRTDPNRTLESQWGDWPNNYSFMSRHPGGANFGLCDGSVTFIPDTIDITTYRHLGNRGDSEPVRVP